MSGARVRVGVQLLVLVLATAAAVAAAAAAAPHLGSNEKAFPLAAFGVAGVLALIVGATVLEPAWLLSIGVGLSIFSGNWKYMHVPGPLDRVVTIVGILAVVARPLFVADAPRIQARRLHWLLAVLTFYAVISAVWSHTLTDHNSLFALIDRLGIEPFLLFIVAPAAFSTPRQRRILLVTLTVIGAYLGLLAIFEVLGPHRLVVPTYINDQFLGIHSGRARGPFLEAGADGLALFTGGVAATVLFAQVASRRVRVLLIAVIGLCLLGILLSETRQVWVGAAAGVVAATAVSPRLRRLLPVGVVIGAALLAAVYFSTPALQAQLKSRTGDQRSLWDRENSDAAALRMFEARPLVGFGWFEFPAEGVRFYHVAGKYPLTSVTQVHNVALSNAAELGALGVGAWLIAVVIAMLSPLTRRRRGPPDLEMWRLGALAVAIAWFVQTNFAPVTYAFDNYMPWIFAAIAYGPLTDRVARPAPVTTGGAESIAPIGRRRLRVRLPA